MGIIILRIMRTKCSCTLYSAEYGSFRLETWAAFGWKVRKEGGEDASTGIGKMDQGLCLEQRPGLESGLGKEGVVAPRGPV